MNYDDIHDYVHDGEGDDSLIGLRDSFTVVCGPGAEFDRREFTRRMNVVLTDKGLEPVCIECSGTGQIEIDCPSCDGEGIQP